MLYCFPCFDYAVQNSKVFRISMMKSTSLLHFPMTCQSCGVCQRILERLEKRSNFPQYLLRIQPLQTITPQMSCPDLSNQKSLGLSLMEVNVSRYPPSPTNSFSLFCLWYIVHLEYDDFAVNSSCKLGGTSET